MAIELRRGLSPVARGARRTARCVLVQQTSMAPAVTIDCVFDAGSLYDPADLPGVSQLVGRVLDRGSLRRSGQCAVRRARRSRRRPQGVDHPPPAVRVLHLPDRGLRRRPGDPARCRPPAGVPRVRDRAAAGRDRDRAAAGRRQPGGAGGGCGGRADLWRGSPVRPQGEGHAWPRSSGSAATTCWRFTRAWVRPSCLTLAIVGDVEPAAGDRAGRGGARGLERAAGRARAGDAAGRAAGPARRADRHAGQVAVGHRLRLQHHPPARSALLRLLDDEQRARPVRPRRPARRQHPRAAGHGLLRLQHLRRQRRRRAADRPGRASIRPTSSGRSRRSTARSATLGADGPTAAEVSETREYLVGSIPRLLETNHEHRRVPADRRAVRPRARLRPPAARRCSAP